MGDGWMAPPTGRQNPFPLEFHIQEAFQNPLLLLLWLSEFRPQLAGPYLLLTLMSLSECLFLHEEITRQPRALPWLYPLELEIAKGWCGPRDQWRPAVPGGLWPACAFSFPRNSIAASAVCVFNLSAISQAFNGPFKYQENSRSAWLPYPNPNPNFQVISGEEGIVSILHSECRNPTQHSEPEQLNRGWMHSTAAVSWPLGNSTSLGLANVNRTQPIVDYGA